MAEAETNLIPLTQENAIDYFKHNGLEPILQKIKDGVKEFVADTSTDKGRKLIASNARKVASAKVAIVNMGKELTEGMRSQITEINAERDRAAEILDAVRDEVRKPYTDWEEAEETRTNTHKEKLAELEKHCSVPMGATSALLQDKLEKIREIKKHDFEEFAEFSAPKIELAERHLEDSIAFLKKQEAEKAELEQLRVQALADVERQKQQAERDRLQEIEDERLRTEAAERKAEADKVAAVEAERVRVAEEKRKADEETAKREANKAHLKKINNEAKNKIVSILRESAKDEGQADPEKLAQAIVFAIAKNEIPHVKITY